MYILNRNNPYPSVGWCVQNKFAPGCPSSYQLTHLGFNGTIKAWPKADALQKLPALSSTWSAFQWHQQLQHAMQCALRCHTGCTSDHQGRSPQHPLNDPAVGAFSTAWLSLRECFKKKKAGPRWGVPLLTNLRTVECPILDVVIWAVSRH